jgi:integrase
MDCRLRDLALFNLGIDSKLRACDLVSLRVSDVIQGGQVARRACVVQQKTGRPVQFEITAQTQDAIADWIDRSDARITDYLFPSRCKKFPYLSTRQYARILKSWVAMIGLDPSNYGTHSMRRTKASLI